MALRSYWIQSWIWLRSWVVPPSPQFDSETIAASNWALDYAPQGQEDVYPLAAEFAKQQYAQSVATYDSLDRKADELIRLTTTIIGAILTVRASKFVTFHYPFISNLALVPTAISVFTTMNAKTPGRASTPMTPRDLLAVADLAIKPAPHQIEGVIAASHHVAMLGMRTMTTWKANQIRRATAAFLIAFVLLLFSMS